MKKPSPARPLQSRSRSYEAFTPKIETIVKEELARIFRDFLKELYPDWSFEQVVLQSFVHSLSLYGMSSNYISTKEEPSEEFIQNMFKKLMD